MKENEATVYLLELLRDDYRFEETLIKKYYPLIKDEETARLLIVLILNLKRMLLILPNGNEITKEAIKTALLVLVKKTNCEYEELLAIVALKSAM